MARQTKSSTRRGELGMLRLCRTSVWAQNVSGIGRHLPWSSRLPGDDLVKTWYHGSTKRSSWPHCSPSFLCGGFHKWGFPLYSLKHHQFWGYPHFWKTHICTKGAFTISLFWQRNSTNLVRNCHLESTSFLGNLYLVTSSWWHLNELSTRVAHPLKFADVLNESRRRLKISHGWSEIGELYRLYPTF